MPPSTALGRIWFTLRFSCPTKWWDFLVSYCRAFAQRWTGKQPSEGWLDGLWELVNAIYVVGLIIGCFLGGYCADVLGRTKTLLVIQVRGC